MTFKKIHRIIVLFLLIGSWGYSQSNLDGRILNDANEVSGVHILNTSTKRATISDARGFFSIEVNLNDTLLFSAVQFKKKELIVIQSILDSKNIQVPMEDILTELDEVVITPYNLSGDIAKDAAAVEPEVTAYSLGLPNANAKQLTQSERLLREASFGKFRWGLLTSVPFNPIINAISGRTKKLKKRVAREKKAAQTDRVRNYYADSLFVKELKIPKIKIADFMFFCEIDPDFEAYAEIGDRIRIWEYMRKKSKIYRKNNNLD